MKIVNLETITFSLFITELLLTIHDHISVFFQGGVCVNGQLHHAALCWPKFLNSLTHSLLSHISSILYLYNNFFFLLVLGSLLKFNTLNVILVELAQHSLITAFIF